jgi:hypothetical protein
MKVIEILIEAKNKQAKLKKPKPRPKKHLWFTDRRLWLNDLNFTHRDGFSLMQAEEEETLYATDKDGYWCYGVWYPKRNEGITFHGQRPINAVKHPRTIIKSLNVGPTLQKFSNEDYI